MCLCGVMRLWRRDPRFDARNSDEAHGFPSCCVRDVSPSSLPRMCPGTLEHSRAAQYRRRYARLNLVSSRSDATLPIQVSIQVHSILYSGEQLPEDVWSERETVVEGYRSVALGGLKRVAVPVGSRHVRSQELDTVTDSTGGD